jgi:hypothetical protein
MYSHVRAAYCQRRSRISLGCLGDIGRLALTAGRLVCITRRRMGRFTFWILEFSFFIGAREIGTGCKLLAWFTMCIF